MIVAPNYYKDFKCIQILILFCGNACENVI